MEPRQRRRGMPDAVMPPAAGSTGRDGQVEPVGSTGARVAGPALEAHYRFVAWMVPTLEKFPRSQKFLLGDRIQSIALDVLEALLEATYTRQRSALLARANLGLEKLRVLCRLSHDLRYLDARRYEYAARCLDEVGRKAGAWRKAHRAREGA